MTYYKIVESEETDDVLLMINGEEWASWSLAAFRKHTNDILYQMMSEVASHAKIEAKQDMRKALGL